MKRLFSGLNPITVGIILVLLMGIFFRVYRYSSNPPSLNWDEVSIGYNAYSLLKTGKDEFGNAWPLYFRSLDDYKMPVYVYATVLSEALFGLTDVAVRLPSLFFGVATLFLVYLLTFRLTGNAAIAILGSGVLAITPWNISFSRMASEANVAVFFLLLGILSFLKGVSGNRKYAITSVFFFGIASYTYLSFRIISPVVGTALFLYFIKRIIGDKRLFYAFLVPAIVLGVMLIRDLRTPTASIRFSGTNFLSHSSEILDINESEMKTDGLLGINIPRRVIHDSPVLPSLRIITKAYLSHFSFDFLLFGTGHKQESSIFSGLIHMWSVPFLLYGLYMLFKTQKKDSVFVLVLLILSAPVPASLTWDVPHAIRTISLSVPIAIITGIGLYYFVSGARSVKPVIFSYMRMIPVVALIIAETYLFFHQYMVHVPVERSQFWQYRRKEMTQYLESVKHRYKKIIISTRLEWPYAFMLYYSSYDPARYLAQGGTRSGGWDAESNAYDNYEFRRINYSQDILLPETLLVGNSDDFSGRGGYVRSFYNLNGTPAIYVFETSGTK